MADVKKIATRDSYGKALAALGLARTLCRDSQADGCRQKTLCYRAVLDPQGRISQ